MSCGARVVLVLGLAVAAGAAAPARAEEVTRRVSVGPGGAEGDRGGAFSTLSPGGRFVAFASGSTNLVPGDTNDQPDVFVRDRRAGMAERVSVGPHGRQSDLSSGGDPAISADGRFVAFASSASNLVAGDTNNQEDVFVRDRWTGRTERVSVGRDGSQGDSGSAAPSLSADGRFVAFASFATNLVPNDTNGEQDGFIHDRRTGKTTRVSVATGGAEANGFNGAPKLSADGRLVAFDSGATNLVPGDTNLVTDVFVHIRRVSRGRPGG